ncbi:PfkB family carbohydrate kinase [Nocardia bovistercoris]|uniref:Carbohydrate kinase PfkB domain-containing protein n=1 Tax=Nocardia bovistercoris TaxID=2785916 RepID=A0A931IDN0_9NOCA|nr:PfkB family carbohydrate kinase [Nocardia bovistercoris]MBH0779529.1 hypothetical protein [Nocardia bovistercoris]
MAPQDSVMVAVRNTLARLGKHRGLATGADRLRTTQVDIAPLLTLPVVRERAHREGLEPRQVVVSVVRDMASHLEPTDRLIADAALALGLLRDDPPPGVDIERLYASDLGARREYLTEHWQELHEILGATRVPPSPTVRTLRATPERRAFTALAALLAGDTELPNPADAARSSTRHAIGVITVIGRACIDHHYDTDLIPTAGGPPARGTFHEHIGGKGVNRAVAAARLGFDVRLITAVGDDPAGRRILRCLRKEGVDVELVKIVPNEPTPVAALIVTGSGAGAIIGAEHSVHIGRDDLNSPAARRAIVESDAVILTFEQPAEIVKQILRTVPTAPDGPWLLVQPTPPSDTPQHFYEYFRRIDYLIGSRQELRGLLPHRSDTESGAVEDTDVPKQLLALGVDTVCTVEGFECEVRAADETVIDIRRFAAVQLRESLGAQAAFTAALVQRLVTRDRPADREAFRWATAAMAATQSFGDIPEAMPDTDEIDRIIRLDGDDAPGTDK